jgi:hypothetical protein
MTATTLSVNDTSPAPRNQQLRTLVIAFVVASLAVVAGIVFIAISVVKSDGVAATVEVVRNLFFILLALEMLLIGGAFTVLLIQVARFANLLQNEVRPILESSTEAVNTIRGTAAFVSEHVVEPVMQANAMMAGVRQAFDLMRDLGSLRDLATAAAALASQGDGTSAEPSNSETG